MANVAVNVTVKLSRDYGLAGVLTYEMTALGVEQGGGTIAADRLTASVLAYFDQFEEQRLPKMKGARKPMSMDVVECPARAIYAKLDKGKRMFRVACGEWQEHGVPFYEEYMTKLGYNPDEFEMGEVHKLEEGTIAVVQMVNGSPKRVIDVKSANGGRSLSR